MEPPKLFRDLVKAGSALEDEAREAMEASAAARHSVEERISRVRENFHNQRPARIEDLNALHKKVDQLTRKLDRLTRALADQGIVEPARTRKAASKAKSSTAGKAKTPRKKQTTARKKASARSGTSTRKRTS
jgi:polyhydroxyalkanoate synthesis regulator phasin